MAERKTETGYDYSMKTDEWLVSPERTWEEVDQELEDRLGVVQSFFMYPDTDGFELGRRYGLEAPAGPKLARFLAYVATVDTQRLKEQTAERMIDEAELEFQSKKQMVRRTYGMRGRANRDIAILDRSRGDKIQPQQKQLETARAIQGLLLRKAVVVLFSATELREMSEIKTSDLPQLIHEARQPMVLGTADMKLSDRNPVNYFTSVLSEYLTRTKDEDLFKRYKYRKSPALVIKLEDCEIMDRLQLFAYSPKRSTSIGEEQKMIQELAKGFFAFLAHRANEFSIHRVSDEPYPHLSLLYDVYCAGFLYGDWNVVSNLNELVDSIFSDRVSQEMMLQESTKLAHLETKRRHGIHSSVVGHTEVLDIEPGDPNILALVPAEVIDYISSIEHRLVRYVEGLPEFLSKYGLPNHSAANQVAVCISRSVKEVPIPSWLSVYDNAADYIKTLWNWLEKIYISSDIHHERGVEVDLSKAMSLYLDPHRYTRRSSWLRPDISERPSFQDDVNYSNSVGQQFRSSMMLTTYLRHFWEDQT